MGTNSSLSKKRIPAIFKKTYRNINQNVLVFLVIGSVIIFYALFLIYPIVQAFLGSFHDWNPLISTYKFVGFKNYIEALSNQTILYSFWITIVFTLVVVAARTAIGLVFAVLITSVAKFKDFFRTVYFIPAITSMVAVAFVWRWLYDPSYGVFNSILNLFGNQGLNWLKDKNLVMPSIGLMTIWKDVGYSIVIYLAGINGIPSTFYEAAAIDGASKYRAFWNITLPLLRPTTLFVVLTSLIGYLQTFTQVFIMTTGGPGTSSSTAAYMIYTYAFDQQNFGLASAISFILFVIILVFSVVQLKATKIDWGY